MYQKFKQGSVGLFSLGVSHMVEISCLAGLEWFETLTAWCPRWLSHMAGKVGWLLVESSKSCCPEQLHVAIPAWQSCMAAGFSQSVYSKRFRQKLHGLFWLSLEITHHHFCCRLLVKAVTQAHPDSRQGYLDPTSYCKELVAKSCFRECSLRRQYESFSLLTVVILLRWTSLLHSGDFSDHLPGYGSQSFLQPRPSLHV